MYNVDDNVVYASDIHSCSDCPLCETECFGTTSDGRGMTVEPPCHSWNDDTEVYVGMVALEREIRAEAYATACEEQQRFERNIKAQRAVATRKQYAHLDAKYQKFKAWLPNTHYALVITARRKNKVYMRASDKNSANYYFNLETEQLSMVRGGCSFIGLTLMNRFENDFKEMYYGTRPVDRDYCAEVAGRITNVLINGRK